MGKGWHGCGEGGYSSLRSQCLLLTQAAIWEAVSLFLRMSPLCQIHGSQNVSDNELDVILVCQAAITKCRRPGGLKNRSLFSHSSGG